MSNRCSTVRRYIHVYTMSIRMISIHRIAGLPLQQLDSICYGDQHMEYGQQCHALVKKLSHGKFFSALNFRKAGSYPKILVHENYKFKILQTRKFSDLRYTVVSFACSAVEGVKVKFIMSCHGSILKTLRSVHGH